ncbi:OLC1v1012099C1 [Oldenlandia corymbosa var. corymbosa]|uniref:Glycosyltransferase n=1 Tax=Oldenlandia corymbosa var. corymbosa TaxID=529605 RepID=A0AAV1DWZ7_OLDCO|nr:OLC1v1012099C1 [Oldenlandia corymbosa var. corymbosa]
MAMKAELIFIPWPLMGHLGQLVEFTKLIINWADTKDKLTIKILISRLPDSVDPVTNTLIDSLIINSSENSPAIEFITLPPTDPAPEWSSLSRGYFIQKQLDSQKPHVKNFIQQRLRDDDDSTRILGIVVDMFSTCMIDVADELGLPSYVFFTSGAAFFRLMLHFQELQDEQDTDVASKFSNSETDYLEFPSFANPVPSSVLPIVLTDEQLWLKRFLPCARGYKRAKGILVNTFYDLESYALDSLLQHGKTQKLPRIYPIGPVLNRVPNAKLEVQSMVINWLHQQPKDSVIYISFGSLGSLETDQVKELAVGLERSGYRFLWVLRRPPAKDSVVDFPSGYDQFWDILPEGFLDRTESIGKVVGWAPQLNVLSHQAVGGFISHCGWNSTLESIWCGVPLATWPLNSEQQLNAFQLVVELGLSVEISLDYSSRKENQRIIEAHEIERAVRMVMKSDSEIRKKVIELRDRSRASVDVGGSSYEALESLINNMMLHNN